MESTNQRVKKKLKAAKPKHASKWLGERKSDKSNRTQAGKTAEQGKQGAPKWGAENSAKLQELTGESRNVRFGKKKTLKTATREEIEHGCGRWQDCGPLKHPPPESFSKQRDKRSQLSTRGRRAGITVQHLFVEGKISMGGPGYFAARQTVVRRTSSREKRNDFE